jgi:hypothetical protein
MVAFLARLRLLFLWRLLLTWNFLAVVVVLVYGVCIDL